MLLCNKQHLSNIWTLFYEKDKDTHEEKAPSNKTSALTKSTNMGIWVVGTSHQLYLRGS